MTFVSYAQNFEDVLLWRALRGVEDGFYIDVGASHPDTDSVSRAFYDRGWRGINIEPVPELHGRLAAARPRDINLRVIAGEASGHGVIHVIAGTGLSTTDEALAGRYRSETLDVREQQVESVTLADICARYVDRPIHFLKIDVEGAEGAVLAGADFTAYRPWVVLVEATAPSSTVPSHQAWEPALLAANYEFLWFDGLNRFYAAGERHAQLAPHFRTPVCVFDNFLRAADSEWTRRISHAEMQAAELLERNMELEAGVAAADSRARDADTRSREAKLVALDAESRARGAELRAQDAEARIRGAEARFLATEARAQTAEQRADAAERRQAQAEAQTAAESQRMLLALKSAQADAKSLRSSTSWQITAPLRGAIRLARAVAMRRRDANGAPPPLRVGNGHRLAAPAGATGQAPRAPENRPSIRTVHQFHSGSATGDAITNAMLLMRSRLRGLGYRSDIFVEHRDPALFTELRSIDELPRHDDYVLIVHHSMGFDAFDRIVALPAAKILMYHNITPAELFDGQPEIQAYIELGRRQLASLRDHVSATLADSEYNAMELRTLGFEDPQTCTLLFDIDQLRAGFAHRPARPADLPFTWLFVGRVVASKCQMEVLEAFARFRELDDRPSRLVLVGRQDGAGHAYADAVKARIAALDLQDHVTMTGLATDEELRAFYDTADIYVSLSRHEGFGVPLIEAAAAGVPVLAWPAGAVAFTLGGEGGLLASRAPLDVARRVASLRRDQGALAAIADAQRASLARFELPNQLGILARALGRAGAAAPRDASQELLFRRNLHVTIAGHVNKTYSLASINRTLARTLEAARPGRVRLMPVEGVPTGALDDVPAAEMRGIEALALRPQPEAGPHVIISQHYPLYVPPDPAEARLALLFWEESRLPAAMVGTLNGGFDAVLAPSAFVGRAVVNSGVSLPVHVVGFAPELGSFASARPEAVARADDIFTFLHVSSAFPRKGVDVLLAAYAQAFRAGESVRLIIKTFPNPHNDVAAQIARLQAEDQEAPPIEHIDRDMSAAELEGLYRDADAMVLPTRGEGFNLPAAEAMAAGIPLIVTGHGGHMDFCGAETVRLVDFTLQPSRSHLATPLSLWAEPDTDDLARALREHYEDRAGATARAALAWQDIRRLLAPDAFVSRLQAAIVNDLLRPPPRPLRLCIVSSWNVRCGIADYTRFLTDAMRHAVPSLEVTILADARFTEAAAGGVQARAAWTVGSPQIEEALRLAVAAEDPDALLIQHQPGLIEWPTLGSLLIGIAAPHRVVAVTLHNTATLPELPRAARDLAVCGLRTASRVIVHTLLDVERLRGLGLSDNVVLIAQGIPEPLPARAERSVNRGDIVTIGACGFILPGKGIPTLVEAAGLLKPRWPNLRLRLVTADYGTRDSKAEAALAREAARQVGLESAVELVTDFLDYDEARRRISGCDLIVLPYPPSKEGSSAALRMAVSAGPCVAVTPIDLFADAEDAVVRLPGCDAGSMAEGIDGLLRDKDLRQQIKVAAKAWVAARSWNEVGAQTVGMLQGLLRSLPGPR